MRKGKGSMTRPLRKVWRYSKAELIELSELRAGDLFQIQRRDEDDMVNESELHLALGDSTPLIPRVVGESTHQIFAGICLAKPMPLEMLPVFLGEAEK